MVGWDEIVIYLSHVIHKVGYGRVALLLSSWIAPMVICGLRGGELEGSEAGCTGWKRALLNIGMKMDNADDRMAQLIMGFVEWARVHDQGIKAAVEMIVSSFVTEMLSTTHVDGSEDRKYTYTSGRNLFTSLILPYMLKFHHNNVKLIVQPP